MSDIETVSEEDRLGKRMELVRELANTFRAHGASQADAVFAMCVTLSKLAQMMWGVDGNSRSNLIDMVGVIFDSTTLDQPKAKIIHD